MPGQARVAGRVAGRAETSSGPFGLAGVVSVGLLYGLVYAGMRLAISPNLPQDDVTSNILAQTLEHGYVLKQPPLYEWMLWSVQRVTGPTLTSLILKYGLLTATFAFLYLVAKRLFADQRWTAVAALSPLLLYHIGWNLHEGVTQTIALICAVAASMWSFMRIAGGAGVSTTSCSGRSSVSACSANIASPASSWCCSALRCGSLCCARACSTGACC
jgi:hypothetical protein